MPMVGRVVNQSRHIYMIWYTSASYYSVLCRLGGTRPLPAADPLAGLAGFNALLSVGLAGGR